MSCELWSVIATVLPTPPLSGMYLDTIHTTTCELSTASSCYWGEKVTFYFSYISPYNNGLINTEGKKCKSWDVLSNWGLCSTYQVTMSPKLRHKESKNVLSLWNNERWHLTWYIEHHPELGHLLLPSCHIGNNVIHAIRANLMVTILR